MHLLHLHMLETSSSGTIVLKQLLTFEIDAEASSADMFFLVYMWSVIFPTHISHEPSIISHVSH